MIEKSLLAFWGAWLLLILVAAFRVFGYPFARRRQDRLWGDGSGPQKPVVLIVAVKGFDLQATPRFFDTLFAQTYGDYRVVVCFESWDDPVAQWLAEHLELGPDRRVWTHPDPANGLRSITLACGGLSEDEGQKVHNQRAAFADLSPRDAIVAFADADIQLGTDWLARLVAPINQSGYELSTTYRWLVPKRPTLPNQFASVINASIVTQGGGEFTNVLWGGSMAISRALFDEIDTPSLLAGSLNDDLRLSKAAKATGKKVAFVRSLILPTPIDFTWRSFFEFVKRQYTQVKFFSPILYTATNAVLAIYAVGLASIVAALVYGYFLAWVPVAAAYVIDQFRALARQQVYLSLFRDNAARQKIFASSWLEHMLTPLWITLHWLLLVSTWTQNRITWAGVNYRILSKSKTRVLGRTPSTATLPPGAPGLAMIGALHDRLRRVATGPIRPHPLPTEPIPAIAAAAEAPAIAVSEPAAVVVEAAIPAPPMAAHPDAPSAILPLTTVFRKRRGLGKSPERSPGRPTSRKRGPVPAIEAARQRLHRPATQPCPSAEPSVSVSPASPPPAASLASAQSPAPQTYRLPGAAERLREKKRPTTPFVRPRPAAEAPSSHRPARPLPAPLALLAAKTRLLGRPVPAITPPRSGARPSPAAPTTVAARFFPASSPASRRISPCRRSSATPVFNGSPRKPANSSSRQAAAPRTAASPSSARPVSRGPSARP